MEVYNGIRVNLFSNLIHHLVHTIETSISMFPFTGLGCNAKHKWNSLIANSLNIIDSLLTCFEIGVEDWIFGVSLFIITFIGFNCTGMRLFVIWCGNWSWLLNFIAKDISCDNIIIGGVNGFESTGFINCFYNIEAAKISLFIVDAGLTVLKLIGLKEICNVVFHIMDSVPISYGETSYW